MLNYLNGVNEEIGAFKKLKAKLKAKKIQRKAVKKLQLKQVSQVQKANILNKAIKKANATRQMSPLTIARIKKQAVVDMNRKNFEEEGEPIVTEAPQEILKTANEKFDEGLEEMQSPENLNPDEADSDEGGEDMGYIWNKGGLKKARADVKKGIKKAQTNIKKGVKDAKTTIKKNVKDAVKNIKDNAGKTIKKYLPIVALARGSFLTLLKFNVFKLRDKIAQGYKKNPKKIENWWVEAWGGNLKVLLKNLKVSKIGMIGEPVTIATALVSASGVVVSIIEVLKSMGIEVKKNENPPLEEQPQPEQPQPEAEQPEAEQPQQEQPEETSEDNTQMEENAEIGIYFPYFSKKKKNPIKTNYSSSMRAKSFKRKMNKNPMLIHGITKKPKSPKAPKKPKAPKSPKAPRQKGQFLDKFNKGLNKFQTGLDKTNTGINKAKNLINITKNATKDIFQGKPAVQANKALTDYKNDVATTTTNKNLLMYGGIGLGAIALILLMKKK